MSRNYAPFSIESAPAVDPARPIRTVIHTADGWKFVGDYATWRGSDRALRNAERTLGSVPESARVGGTDNTTAVRWNTTTDNGYARYGVGVTRYGVTDINYALRQFRRNAIGY